MHYKDGQEVKLGDICKVDTHYGPLTGVVVSLNPGSDSCNIEVALSTPHIVHEPYEATPAGEAYKIRYAVAKQEIWWQTAKECELVWRETPIIRS
jgi:hypothetical protein